MSNSLQREQEAEGQQTLAPGVRRMDWWPWVALLLILLLTAALRIRLLEVPLERDEGEYAYAGQLMLQGIPPFAQVYNMKMPGIYAVYALLIATFGQSIWGIHMGLLAVNAASIVLIFLLGRRLADATTGLAAAAGFAVMSLSGGVLGMFAHATHFLVLFALAGMLVLLVAFERNTKWLLLVTGLLMGLSFMMKQHAAPLIVFVGLYALWRLLRRRPVRWGEATTALGLFAVGVFLPYGLACLLLWWAGVFDTFWFWTFEYARSYVSLIPLSHGITILWGALSSITSTTRPFWVLAALGLVAPMFSKSLRPAAAFLAAFFVASICRIISSCIRGACACFSISGYV